MLDLNEIRNNIDKIDSQLVELFEERMKLTTEEMCIRDRVDTYTKGDTTIVYSVKDSSGNEAFTERVIHVEDTIAPQISPVSYTHLDVYKRQSVNSMKCSSSMQRHCRKKMNSYRRQYAERKRLMLPRLISYQE